MPTNEEVTSELDWMRFFWAFVASHQVGLGDPATASDVFDILEPATWTLDTVWPHLVDAIDNHPDPAISSLSSRFQLLNNSNGVFNDN